MSPLNDETLISEEVIPEPLSFNAKAMASGMPGVPMKFSWRNRDYIVKRIVSTEKNLRPCRSGSGEKYINKHYFSVETESGEFMTLYHTRSASKKEKWMLYTMKKTKAETPPMRIAVLVSGGGTNLQALIDAQKADEDSGFSGKGSFRIVVAIADRESTFALERAKKSGIPAEVAIAPKGTIREEARRIISDKVLALARAYEADALVLAGFLTIMAGPVIGEYSGKIINLHPALLPKFGGKGMWGHHVHEAVLASGDTESGCTVHLVDEGCDTGEILLQRKVPVLPGDTSDTLASRIFGEEHKAIVEGVRLLAVKLMT